MYSGLNDLHIFAEMGDALKTLQAEVDKKLFSAIGTTSEPAPISTLTLGDIEAAVRHVDPDGRILQETRLFGVCRKLSKQQVESLIWMADRMVIASQEQEMIRKRMDEKAASGESEKDHG